MGIGPISAIYQARFMRYLANRGLADTGDRRVWGVFGDGEMDEPESIGALTLAAREQLDNLTFIINCNLQRLDGPVRGNGQIIQELESLFTGAGWNVIKVLWGSDWDALFARDTQHALLRRVRRNRRRRVPDVSAPTTAPTTVEHFFEQDPELAGAGRAHVDGEIDALQTRRPRPAQALCRLRGGASITAASRRSFWPRPRRATAWAASGESRMTAHQQKKLDVDALKAFRDRFQLPLSDQDVAALRFYKPPKTAASCSYLQRTPRRARRLSAGAPARMRRQ